MRRALTVAVLVACLAVGASVGLAQSVFVTYEQLTAGINAPAKSLAALTVEPAGREQVLGCLVRVESSSVRYRVDGIAPTATVGMPVSTGIDTLTLTRLQALQFQVIQHSSASTTALVNVSCWR